MSRTIGWMVEEHATDGSGLQPAPAGPARSLASAVLFLGVVLALVGVVQVANQLTQPGAAVEVLVDEQSLGIGAVEGVPDGAWLELGGRDHTGGGDHQVTMTLQVSALPAGIRALSETPVLVAGAVALAGGLVLRRLLVEIAAGRPFAPGNPGRLRALAALVLAGGYVPGLFSSLATVVTLEHLGARDTPLGFTILDLSLTPILLSAALFVAAAVFGHGRRLTTEVEGLV